MKKLSHYDSAGKARMVDVSEKKDTRRTAIAQAFVKIRPAVLKKLPHNPKGDPLEVARFAGISAAKKTSDLIPLCHPLNLSHVDVEVTLEANGVRIVSSVATTAPTGVEMEALTAASVAALTVYDMTKALDKGIRIREVALVSKSRASCRYPRLSNKLTQTLWPVSSRVVLSVSSSEVALRSRSSAFSLSPFIRAI